MKHRVLNLFVASISALALLVFPMRAVAEGQEFVQAEETLPPVIITEIQTGAATASDEFIELYNRSNETVDIAGWQIRYINSTVTTGATTLLATVTPTSGDSVLLEGGKYFVLHTQSVSLPAEVNGQVFTAALSKTDKTVALFTRDESVCQMVVQDALAWEVTPNTTMGEGAGAVVTATNTNKDKLLQRYRNAAGTYIDTNHNSLDFSLSTTFTAASPGTDNTQLLASPASSIGDPSPLASFEAQDCTIPDPDPDPDPTTDPPDESPPSTTDDEVEDNPGPSIPAENAGLTPPQLSELLPNPASPQTDASDEFIELYNPNNATFNLSGYVLEVGLTTKHRYVLPAGTLLAPKAFKAFFSADTGLALSNTAGQVRLLDPHARVLAQSDSYTAAKDNQVWLLANGKWQWSATPTPNALNVVKIPDVKAKKVTAAKKQPVKKAATKAASTGTKAEKETQALAVASTNSGTPLHPGVLALVGGFALLYGAYEYRHDVANKIRKFRSNREARRTLR